MLFGRALGHERSVLVLEGNAPRHRHRKLSLRPLHFDFAALERDLTPWGTAIGLFPIRDICLSLSLTGAPPARPTLPYQTSQRISPPILLLRAARPLITPRGVVRMLMPRPPTTGRISVTPR